MAKLHCWTDYREYTEEAFGVGSAEWMATFELPGMTCMLEDGHEGPHKWTRDDKISVRFEDSLPPHERDERDG